ncbi:MAG: hypothetical protein K0U66_09300 [Gammaproteobacteria bacterium]|nr:hypothetical protein [Gammaproteobacteria bacterium]
MQGIAIELLRGVAIVLSGGGRMRVTGLHSQFENGQLRFVQIFQGKPDCLFLHNQAKFRPQQVDLRVGFIFEI